MKKYISSYIIKLLISFILSSVIVITLILLKLRLPYILISAITFTVVYQLVKIVTYALNNSRK